MTEAKDDKTPPSMMSSLETLTKVGGVLVAVCIFLGITYNIAFFIGPKVSWLFFLSVTDNIVAAMYAIPHALLAVLGFSVVAVYFRKSGPLGDTSRYSLFWGLFSFVVFGGAIIKIDASSGSFLPEWLSGLLSGFVTVAIFFGLIPLLIYGIAWLIREGSKSPESADAFRPVSLSFLVLLIIVAVAFVARVDRDRLERSRVMAFEIPERNLVSGKLIRALADGFIVAQGDNWIWLPRSEVRRISEVP